MKIREIYVKSFGCLSDFKKEFHDGFNAVTENNGFGKTTLATFVKAMFYSLGYSRSSALEENELKRFRPWNSTEKFGGSVNADEIGLPVEKSGMVLPAGNTAIWTANIKD